MPVRPPNNVVPVEISIIVSMMNRPMSIAMNSRKTGDFCFLRAIYPTLCNRLENHESLMGIC